MGKADAEAVAVRAVDDRTLTVRLNHPVAFFPDLMPFMSFHPVHRGTVEEHDNAWTLPENHVGNGPFRLASWVPHDHILLERNPEYWDTGNVLQQTVRFLPTENISTAFNLYESGECDILTEVPPDAVKQLRGRPDFITGPILATSFYSFNVTGKPFDDVRVRQAFSLAVERENLVKVARGGQKPARHFVPPLFPGFRHPDLEAEALR